MPESISDALRGALDSAPDPIVLVDESGRVAFVNARAERAFGYARAELVGAAAEVLMPEWSQLLPLPLPTASDTHEPTERGLMLVALTEPAPENPLAGEVVARAEVRYRCRDGTDLTGPTTVSRVRAAPDPSRTPRPGAERFRALFEATTVGMVEVAHDHRVLTANAAFCRMTGYTADELTGATFALVLFPEDRADARARFDEIATGQAPSDEADRRYRRKDGSALWARVSAHARHESGERPGVSAVLIDLTDRKSLEEHVCRAQSANAVGLRASYLAHDFNNLLTVINGCAAVLLEGIADEVQTRDLVREVVAACQRAAGLTSQLRTIGGGAPTEPQVFDLNAVAAVVLRPLRRTLGGGITLVADLAENLPGVRADPVQMEQALLNLILNAKDAMPDGGVLAVETRAVRVRPEDRAAYLDLAPGEYVQLAVSDTGHGMPDEVRARAFEPFFTTKAVGKGTGLGLAAVQAAVIQSGGRADVYSESGAGTVVELLLPTAAAPALPLSREGGLVPRCAGTVLLVERDGTRRRLTRLVLRGHGFEVLEAVDFADGRERARRHPGSLALVLSDTIPPGASEPPSTYLTSTPVASVHRARAALGG